MANDWHNPAHWRLASRSLSALSLLMALAACGDDAGTALGSQRGAASCSELSVAECRQQGSCQLLFDDAGVSHCGDERIGLRSCDVMTVDECRLDARCETINGRLFDEDMLCSDVEEPKGCQERGRTCPPSYLYARDQNLKSYQFVRGCAPSGWTRFEPVQPPQPSWPACKLQPGECEARPLDTCQSDRRCAAITGHRVDEEKRCLGDATVLSCVAGGLICTELPITARDPNGQRWWFSSGCIPEGYREAGGDEAVNWALCNPLPPPTPKACAELHPDHCADQAGCTTVRGLVFEPDDRCIRGPKAAFCIDEGTSCPAAIIYARSPADGYAFELPSGCKPPTWASFTPSEVPDATWPGCTN